MGHNKGNYWEIASKENLKVKVIKSIWSFKYKHNPASQIIRHKVRIYTHSGM